MSGSAPLIIPIIPTKHMIRGYPLVLLKLENISFFSLPLG